MGRGGCGAQGRRARSWARLLAPHRLSRRAARLAPEGVNYREFEASAQRVVLIGALQHLAFLSAGAGGRAASRCHRPRAPSSPWLPLPGAALGAPGGSAPSAGAAGKSPRPCPALGFGGDPWLSRGVPGLVSSSPRVLVEPWVRRAGGRGALPLPKCIPAPACAVARGGAREGNNSISGCRSSWNEKLLCH